MKNLLLFMTLLVVMSCTKNEETPQEQIITEDLAVEEILPPEAYNVPIDVSQLTGVLEKKNPNRLLDIPASWCDLNPLECTLWEKKHSGSTWNFGKTRFVIVAEGFTDDNMGVFNTYADSVATEIKTKYEWRGTSTGANTNVDIYYYRTQSNESGVTFYDWSNSANDVLVDTYWNTYLGVGYRLIFLDQPDIDRLRNELVSATGYLPNLETRVIMIVNEGTYAGVGNFRDSYSTDYKMTWCATTKDTERNSFIPLVTHEMGHMFYLDDTYVDLNYDPVANGWCDRANVTQDIVNQPIIGTDPYLPGGQYDNNHWRRGNDRMKALNYGWNYTSQQILRKYIANGTLCKGVPDCIPIQKCRVY